MKRKRERREITAILHAWKFTVLYSGDVYTVEVGPS